MRLRTANNKRRAAARRSNRLFWRAWTLLADNCEVCHGAKGGVRGNENRINGWVACDYCHADGSAEALPPRPPAVATDGSTPSVP